MSQRPMIAIPLDISQVRVLQTEQTKDGEFILTVESTLPSTLCRRCGSVLTELHGLEEARLLRHLPVFGHPVYLVTVRPILIHERRPRCTRHRRPYGTTYGRPLCATW